MSPQNQSVEMTMADPGPEHSLFDEATEAIQSTISEEHRRTFRHHADVTLMLADLRAICNGNVQEQRRLLACCKKFSLFASTFAPYFELLSIWIQVRPGWVGWFWGTVQLTFEAGSSYVLFLERIAEMFETIAHVLPRYQQLHASCSQHGAQSQSYDERLAVTMSYVYADLVQFCLDLYRMCSRGLRGPRLRHLRLSSPTILWRPLDSRFAQLEARLVRHKIWLEAEAEAEDANQEHGRRVQHRRAYIEFLHNQFELSESSELIEQRMARRMRRVDKVKAWLGTCCAYRDVYEHRLRQRHPKSCSWFLRSKEYSKWKNSPFSQTSANDLQELESRWQDRVMFVQAEPGFGKSFISGAVIDDLNIDDEFEPPSTAFFHFNAAHSYCIHPNDAFRALVYQLVHIHRHDRSTLDAISILMRKTPSQSKASADDVLAVLSLLLRQHPTFLVVDGVDECNDVRLFLHSLPELCRRSDTRVILFSRPNIDIPLDYRKWASDSPHILTLDEESNKEDIETYVTETLNRMADQGYFGISMDRSLIALVAGRANGMFLWVGLLLKYLQSPGLSPNERHAVLEQVDELEGMDSLYRQMLAMLSLRPQQEKQLVANLFRWLALSINRLCIPGLQTALAINLGQRLTDSSDFHDFSEVISRLTCGLIEVTQCSVIFAHRSVKEYLQSSNCRDLDLGLYDDSVAHAHLAARCLSFLANDLPKRPLGRLPPHGRPQPVSLATSSGLSMMTSKSGDSGYKSMSSASDSEYLPTPASTPAAHALGSVPSEHSQRPTPTFDTDLPFLRYAALCWPIHLTRALSTPSSRRRPTPKQSFAPFEQMPWLPSLSNFLTDHAAVTDWVEASWRYNLPPNVSRLIPLLSPLKSEVPPATIEGRELRWVVHGVMELSHSLNELKEEYGTTLKENPGLIWQWRGAWGGHQTHATSARGAGAGRIGSWPVSNGGVGRGHHGGLL